MAIQITIVSTNIPNRECVVRVTDGSDVIIDNKNIGLDELNPDGTANTTWIKSKVRDLAFSKRIIKAAEDDPAPTPLSIDINN